MRAVCIATSNRGKARFIAEELGRFGIPAKHRRLEMPEPRSYDLREIAEAKARYAYSKVEEPCLVLDSGFYIGALNGFPRTFVNFALETIGVEGMLKLVEGKSRRCEFRDCLAYLDGSLKKPVYFESAVQGRLAKKPNRKEGGSSWSELHRVFIPEGTRKTLSGMSEEEYWDWIEKTRDGMFLKKFAGWFTKREGAGKRNGI